MRWEVSIWAILLFSLAYFFDESGVTAALIPAAAAHELGHLAALRLLGVRLRRVQVGVFGVEMDYTGHLGGAKEAAAAAAGPLAGLIYAAAGFAVGLPFWRLSAGISGTLSAFNLLPVLPLDGGRIAAAFMPRKAALRLSRILAPGTTAAGAFLLFRFGTASLLLMGAYLMAYNFR